MNWDQIYALLRSVLLALGASLVTKGVISGDTLNAVVGAIVGIVPIVLSQIFHMNAGQSIVAPPAAQAKPAP